jgi:hypothetical protein
VALKIEVAANAAASAWTDITDIIDITSIKAGGRAANGESEQLGFNLDDDAAAIDLPAHRVVRFTEDATAAPTVIGWGRVQSVDIGRGKLFSGDARQYDVQLTDVNGELRGVVFPTFIRPAEVPGARMRGLINHYFHGTWRASTNLNYTTYVPLTAFDDMPKKTYARAHAEDVLSDIASTHDLLYFVTNEQEVFLDSRTSGAYASTIAISDDGDDDGETIFAPIFEGPGNSKDGDQVLSEVISTYGTNRYVYIRRSAAQAAFDRWGDVINIDTTSKNSATNKANSTLDRHAIPESSIRCKVLFREDQVDLIKHGHTLAFRAAAAGILSPLTFRVASLIWEFAGPGYYLASLELSFPRKVAGTIDHSPPPPPLPPFDPAGEGSFTFVQSAKTPDGTDEGDATLGSAPDAGNFLVAVTAPEQPGGSIPDWDVLFPDGWSLDADADVANGSGTVLGQAIASKISDGSETLTEVRWGTAGSVTPASDPGDGFLIVAEYDVGDGEPTLAQTMAGVLQDDGAGSTVTPAVTPTPGSTALITWLVLFRPNYAPTVSAGWNIRESYDTTGGSRLRLLMVDRIVTNASGSYSATLTSPGGTDSNGWILLGAVYEFSAGQPRDGQPVAPESAVSDGVRSVYQTNYPYEPGSLVVKVNGTTVAVEETDPPTGVFTLVSVPAAGATITWTYNATEDTEPTGANNPPPPSNPPGTPGNPGDMPGGDGVYRPPIQPYTPAEDPDGVRTVFTIVPYVAGQATQLIIGSRNQRKGTDWWELDPAAGTVELDEAPLGPDAPSTDFELITVWAMPLVSSPPPPPPPSSPSSSNHYGPAIQFDSKSNFQVGPQGDFGILFTAGVSDDLDSILIQARGDGGASTYSGGDGGDYDVDLYAADANGHPTGSILAHATYSPGNPAGPWTHYDTITWGSPFTTVLGNRYFVKIANTDGSPLVNYFSINSGFVFGATQVPRQPAFADLAFGALSDSGSGWVFHRQGGDFTPNVDLAYAGGHHDGMGYIQNMETTTYSGGTHVPGIVSGASDMVRERVTVSGGDRRILDFHVRGRLNSGAAPLVVKCKQGATVLGTISIPASAFSPATAPYLDNGGSKWGAGSWAATITLEDAGTYDFELSTAAGTTYSFAPIRKGTDEGFDPSLVFMDGQAEFTTDGGSSYDPLYPFDTDAPNLQWYSRVTT